VLAMLGADLAEIFTALEVIVTRDSGIQVLGSIITCYAISKALGYPQTAEQGDRL
jgi:hypothetical protein